MAQWKPQKIDVLDALAAEILHNYGRGRVIVAVDGVDGATQFAGDLAAAFERAGRAADVIPFAEFAGASVLAPDSATIVAGTGLIDATVIGNWNFAVRLTSTDDTGSGARAARAAADAIIDTTDSEHPRRVFADSC